MRKGKCIAKNTFFQAEEVRFEENGLHCLLASGENAVTSAQVKWLYPDGNLVNCSKKIGVLNEIGCSNAANNNGTILYTSRNVNNWPLEYSGVYTCCLPGKCFDGSTNSITIRIFGQSLLYLYDHSQLLLRHLILKFTSNQVLKQSLTFMSLYLKM